MLKTLTVNNFALIETATLDFNNGFTVITGETGSGKSIMLGALRMILGERADFNVIRDQNKKTIVEGVFDLSNLNLIEFFDENDLDYLAETIVRREIHAKGKSRAFINDTPVQLTVLKMLMDKLIHIHSQHHTINLKSKSFQLELLDVWSEHTALKKELTELYDKWKNKEKLLENLKETAVNKKNEADFNKFLLEELAVLSLENTDYEEIEQQLNRAEKFEDIKRSFQLIIENIDGERGANLLLNEIKKNCTTSDPKLESLAARIEQARIELVDVASSASDEILDLEMEPRNTEELIQKLDKFNTALKKHNCSSQQELMKVEEELSNNIAITDNIDNEIKEAEEIVQNLKEKVLNLASKLSKSRKDNAPRLTSEIINLLDGLKLPESRLDFDFDQKEISANGLDNVSLLFSPNKGLNLQPIEKAASGGELSRLMLVIQYILSKRKKLPTVIFDEIDTGVSGEVAERIGIHLKAMGDYMQLMAITHLPQVAGKGENHICVRKNNADNATFTIFEYLNDDARVDEIAKLMSGSKVNQAAIDNAKNLMNN